MCIGYQNEPITYSYYHTIGKTRIYLFSSTRLIKSIKKRSSINIVTVFVLLARSYFYVKFKKTNKTVSHYTSMDYRS